MKTRIPTFRLLAYAPAAVFALILPVSLHSNPGRPDDSPAMADSPVKPSSLQRKNYQRGFYEGAFLFSVIQGITVATSGSFIAHEKQYDDLLKTKITAGVAQNRAPGFDQVYFDSQYIPRDSGQIDFEYGVTSSFGLGLTAFQYAIGALRQDVVPVASYTREVVDPVPVERNLYQGNAVMVAGFWHPSKSRLVDPYMAVRVGFVGFAAEAHSGMDYNRYRYSNQVRNGIGTVVGAAAGTNFHITPFVGLKIEASYYREFLKSDQFATRTLNSYHVQAGIVLNYTSSADAIDTAWEAR